MRQNCVWALLAVLFTPGCFGSWTIGARTPRPTVNIQGPNLRLALVIGQQVPNQAALMEGRLTCSEIHRTLSNAFLSAYEARTADPRRANLWVELASLDMMREDVAGRMGVLTLRYRATLRLAATGEVLRTAAGMAVAKNPFASDWERIYDDTFEVLFEDITRQLFPSGVLPKIPERDPKSSPAAEVGV